MEDISTRLRDKPSVPEYNIFGPADQLPMSSLLPTREGY